MILSHTHDFYICRQMSFTSLLYKHNSSPHPAKMLKITVQPTMKGTMGFLVLTLTAPSSNTMVIRQVMATSPNRAPATALFASSTANAAPWALANFAPEVIACWHPFSYNLALACQESLGWMIQWCNKMKHIHLCHSGSKHPSKQLAYKVRGHHIHLNAST